MAQERPNKLHSRRIELGLTASEIARRVGTSRQSIQQWESGQYVPRASILRRLAEAYEVPLDAIVTALARDDG